MKSLFIALPIHRFWAHESQAGLEACLLHSEKKIQLLTLRKMYEESLIQRARNTLIKDYLEKSKAEYFFFMDDDVVPINHDALELLTESGKDIIAGAYIMKKPPYKPTFYPLAGAEIPDLRGKKEPIEVQYVATGFTLYSREVCRAVYDAHQYPFDCMHVSPIGYLSEDWVFCHRARELGFKCFIHPLVELGHLGTYAYSMNDYYFFRERGDYNA